MCISKPSTLALNTYTRINIFYYLYNLINGIVLYRKFARLIYFLLSIIQYNI